MSETPINPAEDRPSYDPARDDDEQDVDDVQVPGTPATGPEAPIPPTEA